MRAFRNRPGIYCITNLVNNKRYVGQAQCIYRRYKEHSWGRSKAPKLENAIKKYGWNAFKFEVLEECSINLLCDREEFWITKLDSISNGYNILLRHDAPRRPHSKETRIKIKIGLKHAFPNGVGGENNPMFGKQHSKGTLKMLSLIAGQRKHVPNKKAVKSSDGQIFESVKAAAINVSGCANGIWRAIKFNRPYKNLSWQYV